MKTPTLFTNCLTFDQLTAYSNKQMDATSKAQLYQHIITCELCTCAINGFTAIPFTAKDITSLNKKMDIEVNPKQDSKITFAQICVIIVSLIFIYGFYSITNSIQQKSTKQTSTTNVAINEDKHLQKAKYNVNKDENNIEFMDNIYTYQEAEGIVNDRSCVPKGFQ